MKKNCLDCYYNVKGLCILLGIVPDYPFDCIYEEDAMEEVQQDD